MSKVSMSQVSNEIFEFITETGYTYEDMFAVLRGFIHSEYERESAVLDRLKRWLLEVKEAEGDIDSLSETKIEKKKDEVHIVMGDRYPYIVCEDPELARRIRDDLTTPGSVVELHLKTMPITRTYRFKAEIAAIKQNALNKLTAEEIEVLGIKDANNT